MPQHIIIAPDAFKGCLSAPQVAEAIAQGIRESLPDATTTLIPLADGGEGTVACVAQAREGEPRVTRVSGADGSTIEAQWFLLEDEAILETAQVVGLANAQHADVPVQKRSSLGLGELIIAAMDAGARRIALGLGGSSTNDGGAGMLAALGACLMDARGNTVEATPEGLTTIAQVDLSRLDRRLNDVELIGLCDVTNPLTGPRGATAVYGPQKGISSDRIKDIDHAIDSFARAMTRTLVRNHTETPGAGAAGGLGFALLCLGGELRSGADYLIQLTGLSDRLAAADLVITGEGRSDSQTAQGKLPAAVARHARAASVPVILLCGGLAREARRELRAHFDGCFSIADGPASLATMQDRAAELLSLASAEIASLTAALAR